MAPGVGPMKISFAFLLAREYSRGHCELNLFKPCGQVPIAGARRVGRVVGLLPFCHQVKAMSEKPAEIGAEVLVPEELGATSTYRSRLERTDQDLKARPPTISGYEILGELGHGGMGVVYRARQISLNRIVALKMIRSGDLASSQDLARFRREAEAVARLKHSNIVHIYEVGDDDGRPYLSLEYVEGGSLAQGIKGTPQPSRLAAELVETLSRAVHAAHQCGIIHRDLKPSNVLLTPDRVPKITDFGLAKRLDDDLGQTQTGAVLGTPSYMAPEQAAGRSREIGPATDIYALGAILYELVTGRPPFLADSHEATRQLVMNDEPLPPRRLQPSLPRNLETICLKCLQKEPAKRYSSALVLAEDLGRFLSGKPILARPATMPERLLRWCRRNPWAASFILALVIGTAVSIYFAVDARHKADLAQKRLIRFENTLDIMMDIFADFDIRKVKAGDEPVEAVLAQRLVKAGDELEGEAIGEPLLAARLQERLGMTLVSLGHQQEAIPVLLKARETWETRLGTDHPDTLRSIGNLAVAYREAGKPDAALPLLEETLQLSKAQLGADHPGTLATMNNLAGDYLALGRLELALPLLENTLNLHKAKLGVDHPSTLSCMNTLANCYWDAAKMDRALPLYEETLKLRKTNLGADHPDTLESMNNLANAYRAAGRLDRALPLYEETEQLTKAKLGAKHPGTLRTMNNLGSAYRAAGKLELALPLLQETLTLQKAKLGADHPDTVATMNNLALAYKEAAKLDLALPLLQEVLTLTKAKLGADHPETLVDMNNLARGYQAASKLDLALPLFQEAAAGMEKRRFQHLHAGQIVINLIDCYEQLKQFDQAEAWQRKWLAVVKERSGPDSASYASELGYLGANLLKQKKWTEAESALRESLAFREKNERDAWTTFHTQSMLGGALLGEARSASEGGDQEALARASGLYRDAEALLLKGYGGLKQRAAKIPEPARIMRLTEAAARLVQLYEAQEKKDQAAKWRKELAAIKSK
jgi:serine/threonine protein kinase